MKILTMITSTTFAVAMLAASSANAATEYYVYKKGSECEISMSSPDKFARGSSWKYVGKDSTRSGAKKVGKSAGCSSF